MLTEQYYYFYFGGDQIIGEDNLIIVGYWSPLSTAKDFGVISVHTISLVIPTGL